MSWFKGFFKKENKKESHTDTLNTPVVSVVRETFRCPLPDARCDRHKIDDEEGRWEFCNTCKMEWGR